ncbi:winged helix-turn-helix domain-containing protein [Kitasatospora mediocidica]|uniref:winged helix-turn-helix domain-containing protein n=1 Tax=Kitasatospora mediocidica TaxID=58352 RepID=UPI0009FFC03E|nr:winged helix-turn-helix domain-containing protein [Kitasatospora mediocidica]
MSSSSAVLSAPAATPHLRAVRSVSALPTGAERWHNAAAAPHTPAPHGVAAPSVAGQGAPASVPVVPELLNALPAGAAVVAALPHSALPQGLIAQYGAQLGVQVGAHPLVGYLVLVPAGEVPVVDQLAAVRPGPHPSPVPADRPARAARPAARGISVDLDRRLAYVDNEQLDLTYLEFELLAHLTQHPQRVHTRDYLVSAVWGYGHVGDGRTVDVHVARLRRKLGAAHRDSIVTVRRVGYKYAPAAGS